MTALRMSLTLVALFVSSFGAALGLYAAAFIALDNDIDPFMRAIHQQSEWAAWAGATAVRRSSGTGPDQMQDCHQPQDSEDPRPRNSADSVLARADEVIE
jgi:hypothetical protein